MDGLEWKTLFFNGWFGGTYPPIFGNIQKSQKDSTDLLHFDLAPCWHASTLHATKLMRSFSPRRALEGKNGVAADVLSKNGTPKRKLRGSVVVTLENLELP